MKIVRISVSIFLFFIATMSEFCSVLADNTQTPPRTVHFAENVKAINPSTGDFSWRPVNQGGAATLELCQHDSVMNEASIQRENRCLQQVLLDHQSWIAHLNRQFQKGQMEMMRSRANSPFASSQLQQLIYGAPYKGFKESVIRFKQSLDRLNEISYKHASQRSSNPFARQWSRMQNWMGDDVKLIWGEVSRNHRQMMHYYQKTHDFIVYLKNTKSVVQWELVGDDNGPSFKQWLPRWVPHSSAITSSSNQ